MYIVSPNYRDRRADLRWFIRENSKPPKGNRAVSSIYAYGVKFEYSRAHEQGFSCDMVALCDNAVVDAQLPEGLTWTPIRFHKGNEETHMGFYVGETRDRIHECQYLVLQADGSMLAVL